MTAYLLTYGQILKTRLVITANHLQDRIDGVLKVEEVPDSQPKKGGLPVWAIILIIVGVVLCLCPVVIFVVLALMGPQIGNVLSDIIVELE
ncbi:MAG: hypothetical protein JXB07_00285 [Anaerolineae bacterium]|nr:hypothetical protein [Anaerolineae bacterium]